MALVGSGFMPKTMLRLPLPSSNSYHHKAVTIRRCAARKGRKPSKGDGPKINRVLRTTRRIEDSVRDQENIAPFSFNAVEENKDSKKDDTAAQETEENIAPFSFNAVEENKDSKKDDTAAQETEATDN